MVRGSIARLPFFGPRASGPLSESHELTCLRIVGLCLDFSTQDVDNAPGWFSERVSVSRDFCDRLPLPLSAAPPGGPPFLAPFSAAPKVMVGLCLFPNAGDASWERSFIVAI